MGSKIKAEPKRAELINKIKSGLLAIPDSMAENIKSEIDEGKNHAFLEWFMADDDEYKIEGSTAVIKIHGFLYKEKYDKIHRQIKTAMADGSIDNILLDIYSSGGIVDGVSELSDFIFTNRDKITAYVGSEALSAAYWLASQTGRLVAHKSAFGGSIGVYKMFYSYAGEQQTIISSDVSPAKIIDPKTPEGEAAVKREVNFVADQFVDNVARGREVEKEYVINNYGQGAIIPAVESVGASGMFDEISDMENLLVSLNSGFGQYQNRGPKPDEGTENGFIDNKSSAKAHNKITGGKKRMGKTISKLIAAPVIIDDSDVPEGVQPIEITVDVIKNSFPEIAEALKQEGRNEMQQETEEVAEVAANANLENPAEKELVTKAMAGQLNKTDFALALVKAKAEYKPEQVKQNEFNARAQENPQAGINANGGDLGGGSPKKFDRVALIEKMRNGGFNKRQGVN